MVIPARAAHYKPSAEREVYNEVIGGRCYSRSLDTHTRYIGAMCAMSHANSHLLIPLKCMTFLRINVALTSLIIWPI